MFSERLRNIDFRKVAKTAAATAVIGAAVNGCGALTSSPDLKTPNPDLSKGYDTAITINYNLYSAAGNAFPSRLICYTNAPVDIEPTTDGKYSLKVDGQVSCPVVDDNSRIIREDFRITGDSPIVSKLDIISPQEIVSTSINSSDASH